MDHVPGTYRDPVAGHITLSSAQRVITCMYDKRVWRKAE